MRISVIIVGFVLFAGQDMMAMKRSPRKALQQVENPDLIAHLDKIKVLKVNKLKEWSLACVSPAEPKNEKFSPFRIEAAVKTHAALLNEKLRNL